MSINVECDRLLIVSVFIVLGNLMKKLRLVRSSVKKTARGLFQCPVVVFSLANGEVTKRGCGRKGMSEFDGGLRCLYCGNYIYQKAPSLESMWFHFRWAREFWNIHNEQGRDFVNGVPVTGRAETLPAACLPDLAEFRPPRWFASFLKYDDQEFREYLLNSKTG